MLIQPIDVHKYYFERLWRLKRFFRLCLPLLIFDKEVIYFLLNLFGVYSGYTFVLVWLIVIYWVEAGLGLLRVPGLLPFKIKMSFCNLLRNQLRFFTGLWQTLDVFKMVAEILYGIFGLTLRVGKLFFPWVRHLWVICNITASLLDSPLFQYRFSFGKQIVMMFQGRDVQILGP